MAQVMARVIRWLRTFREHFCPDSPHGFPPPTLQCLYLAAPSYMGDMGAGKGWPWDLPSGKPCFMGCGPLSAWTPLSLMPLAALWP